VGTPHRWLRPDADHRPVDADRHVRITKPFIQGPAIVGKTLRCSPPGRWSGSLPIRISVSWSRNGTPVRRLTGAAYIVRARDVGQRLWCSATATNQAGKATARSAAVIGDPSCRRFVGRALKRCRARQNYDNARTACNEIGTTTSHGRNSKRACVAVDSGAQIANWADAPVSSTALSCWSRATMNLVLATVLLDDQGDSES
jgi:hypothetical protein